MAKHVSLLSFLSSCEWSLTKLYLALDNMPVMMTHLNMQHKIVYPTNFYLELCSNHHHHQHNRFNVRLATGQTVPIECRLRTRLEGAFMAVRHYCHQPPSVASYDTPVETVADLYLTLPSTRGGGRGLEMWLQKQNYCRFNHSNSLKAQFWHTLIFL